MSKPVLLIVGPYPDFDMEVLEREYSVLKLWENVRIDEHADQIRALATRGDLGASKELIAQLPKLEIIACNGVGVDAIDFNSTRTRGIKVSNTPDVLNDDVADLTLGLMLGISRQIAKGDAFVRSGQWATTGWPLQMKMSGKRLGLLGMGRIGQAIAKRAEAFSMPVAYHTRNKRDDVGYAYYPALTELARDSDYLVAILPGGAGTQNIINAEVLKALGPTGIFVNVARGTVADEEALLQALENKTIAGAALDVYWNEPKINPRFFALENALLHPHGGSATLDTRKAMGKLVRDNLAAHFAGKPLLTPVG